MARLEHLVATGAIDRDAIVIRPLCMCDQAAGHIEANFVDQVIRRSDPVGSAGEGRVFRYGDVAPGEGTATTVKLG